MKKKTSLLFLVLISTLSYAQSTINLGADLITDGINIGFHPKDLLSTITIATRSKEDRKEIVFFLAGKAQKFPPNIRIDSLILRSNDHVLLTLHHLVSDSVVRNGDYLTWYVVHGLDAREAKFIEEKKIDAIILTVNKSPVQISISQKSQKRLQQLAIAAW